MRLHERRPRAAQSEAASALLADLRRVAGLSEGPSSKSHSRGFSAAAAAQHGRVGIDVEWAGAPRDPAALARFLLGPETAIQDATALYRLWTFREAYFKAFGGFPNMKEQHALLGQAHADDAPLLHDEYAVMFKKLDGDFLLCVLWQGGEDFIALQL